MTTEQEGEEAFTMVTHEGLFPSRRVSLVELIHGERVGEAICFNILQTGVGGPLRKNDAGTAASKCLLVVLEDVSEYVRLEPLASCMATVSAETLLWWCAAMEWPRVWVSDKVWHLKKKVLRLVAGALGILHSYAIENSPWTNGMVKRMMRERRRTCKLILN